jgi:hypothetical protein
MKIVLFAETLTSWRTTGRLTPFLQRRYPVAEKSVLVDQPSDVIGEVVEVLGDPIPQSTRHLVDGDVTTGVEPSHLSLDRGTKVHDDSLDFGICFDGHGRPILSPSLTWWTPTYPQVK